MKRPTDEDLADHQAQASPRDWPQDFDQETTWNVCEWCIHLFLGTPTRIRCRACADLPER